MLQADSLIKGDFRSLARAITAVENHLPGYRSILERLADGSDTRIIGITGPPGAGKSTLTDALLAVLLARNPETKIAILAVDPSSPFHHGALLGDRIRMRRHDNHQNVFIRSLASRGSLGGLPPEMIGISELVSAWGFDYLIIETVGVGQSEVEIASLAQTSVVVLVPASGDEIQTMKAGLMEIADIFVVNKSDLPFADDFVKHLQTLVKSKKTSDWPVPVIKTIATGQQGMDQLAEKIEAHHQYRQEHSELKVGLMARKAFQLIQAYRMQDITTEQLQNEIRPLIQKGTFNLYRYAKNHVSTGKKK